MYQQHSNDAVWTIDPLTFGNRGAQFCSVLTFLQLLDLKFKREKKKLSFCGFCKNADTKREMKFVNHSKNMNQSVDAFLRYQLAYLCLYRVRRPRIFIRHLQLWTPNCLCSQSAWSLAYLNQFNDHIYAKKNSKWFKRLNAVAYQMFNRRNMQLSLSNCPTNSIFPIIQ